MILRDPIRCAGVGLAGGLGEGEGAGGHSGQQPCSAQNDSFTPSGA